MSLLHKFAALGGNPATTYVDDVFSAYTYIGNGSTQTITNGVDLAGKGGLVWLKRRSTVQNNFLQDTVRGITNTLISNDTSAQSVGYLLVASVSSSGFTLNSFAGGNASSETYVSWTFRKAAKFFDVVTYTGDGTTQAINHSLGQAPGMVVIKCTSGTGDWAVWHRSATSGNYLLLNSTASQASAGAVNIFGNNSSTVDPTSTGFTVGSNATVNGAFNYVAYVFAHDTATDGLIQCGSFTTDGSGNATVTLGWEPQYLMVKSASVVNGWWVFDVSRGMIAAPGTANNFVSANSTSAEASFGAPMSPTATGFASNGSALGASVTYIYMAIRRPNKPPTTGTQVYNAIARTGTGAAATVTGVGFAPDLVMGKKRASVSTSWFIDRLRGRPVLDATATAAEVTPPTTTNDLTSFDMDGFSLGTASSTNLNISPNTEVYWNFKRAPGVFDEVCYTGTGSATTVAHNLGVAPELMIVKNRTTAKNWGVYFGDVAKYMYLNDSTTGAISAGASTFWNSTAPTASVFSLGTETTVNQSTNSHVAYLFATKAGISKVGTYTGNGSSLTVNCGFSAGARFIFIRRTDAGGDWFVWDSTRGIVAGNDPHLSLNTTAAEVTTDDSVDTDTTGFVVNQLAATNVNVTSATYIYLAFA